MYWGADLFINTRGCGPTPTCLTRQNASHIAWLSKILTAAPIDGCQCPQYRDLVTSQDTAQQHPDHWKKHAKLKILAGSKVVLQEAHTKLFLNLSIQPPNIGHIFAPDCLLAFLKLGVGVNEHRTPPKTPQIKQHRLQLWVFFVQKKCKPKDLGVFFQWHLRKKKTLNTKRLLGQWSSWKKKVFEIHHSISTKGLVYMYLHMWHQPKPHAHSYIDFSIKVWSPPISYPPFKN